MRDLPPPPSKPEISPPVHVAGEVSVTLSGLPGEPPLEARVRADPGATRAVLLCHPHPLYGGTMHSAVVVAIARVLAERGASVATLRFNYRGVGASGGSYGRGLGEILDARSALRALKERAPRAKLTVCGYSFGTWVGLRAAAVDGGVERVALIAPAVRVFDFIRDDAARLGEKIAIYVGDHDEFCDVVEARDLALSLAANLEVLEGCDHFFLSSRRKLALAVTRFVAPESLP